MTQAQVGDLIGVNQPAAGRLLGHKHHAGFSRPSANRLAVELGYRHHEDLLLDLGVLAVMKEAPTGAAWTFRDAAVRIAQHLQYDGAAIDAVVARFTGDDYRRRPPKWWLARFGEEETRVHADRLDDEQRRVPPVPAKPSDGTSKSARPKKSASPKR